MAEPADYVYEIEDFSGEQLLLAAYLAPLAPLELTLVPEYGRHVEYGQLRVELMAHSENRTVLAFGGPVRIENDSTGAKINAWGCGSWKLGGPGNDGTFWLVNGERALYGPAGLIRGHGWGRELFRSPPFTAHWLTLEQALERARSTKWGSHQVTAIWQSAWRQGRSNPDDFLACYEGSERVPAVDWQGFVDFLALELSTGGGGILPSGLELARSLLPAALTAPVSAPM